MGSSTTLNIILNNIEGCLCHNTSHHFTNPDGPNSRELIQSNELTCQKGKRISGEKNVAHIRLSNKAFTPQSSSEATQNYEHILRQPWASIPDGLAAPTVWRAAAQTTKPSRAQLDGLHEYPLTFLLKRLSRRVLSSESITGRTSRIRGVCRIIQIQNTILVLTSQQL